jgi:hypothetical protein
MIGTDQPMVLVVTKNHVIQHMVFLGIATLSSDVLATLLELTVKNGYDVYTAEASEETAFADIYKNLKTMVEGK